MAPRIVVSLPVLQRSMLNGACDASRRMSEPALDVAAGSKLPPLNLWRKKYDSRITDRCANERSGGGNDRFSYGDALMLVVVERFDSPLVAVAVSREEGP